MKETSTTATTEIQEMSTSTSAVPVSILISRDRYIEYHMKQRLGQREDTKSGSSLEDRDLELFAIPDNLKVLSETATCQ